MSNIKNMTAKRVTMLTKSMDANNRDTDEASMKRHSKGFKDFVNNVEGFDNKKIEQYCNEYCENDDNFKEIEVVEKQKRTLSDKQKELMADGFKAAKAAREAAAAAGAEKAEESEKDEKAEEKPKKAKAKVAKVQT